MQTGEISFAGRIGYNIKLDDAKQRVLDELERQFRFKVIQKHFDKFTTEHLNKINNSPHLISVRTNGNPYLLFLTKVNFVNQCLFIDKKVQQGYFLPRVVVTKFRFDDELFQGTLFDGEMVKDKNGQWLFIINDMIGNNDMYLENVNLVKRLNLVYDILKNKFVPDEYDVCAFQVKRYFKYHELKYVLSDFIPNLPYTCRGIYFKPLFLKFKDILVNFDDTLVQKVVRQKYKDVSDFLLLDDKKNIISNSRQAKEEAPAKNCINVEGANANKTKSIQVYIKKTNQPDVYETFDVNNNNCGFACIPTLKVSKFMREIFQNKNLTDKILMQCLYSERFDKYIPDKVLS